VGQYVSTHRPRIRDLGVKPGVLDPGEINAITDVPGVDVGHRSVIQGSPSYPPCVRTGVSVIDPNSHQSLYSDPMTAGTYILNGYGKSVGIPQIDELGEIETPILLTNTLSTWDVANAMVSRVLEAHENATSVNPVVGECNDGVLNDIRGGHITANHVADAFDALGGGVVEEGSVGAGVGTTGFGWKAGIGSASRIADDHTVGVLVLTNTGKPDDLRIDGLSVDQYGDQNTESTSAGGSIMMIVGTDADLSARQLNRCLKRTSIALGRVGGIAHHGSGDFSLGFSNGHGSPIKGSDLTVLFRGIIEATEEAIYNSLSCATTVEGFDGNKVEAMPIASIKRAVANRKTQ
jgi:D-aminopeptidase